MFASYNAISIVFKRFFVTIDRHCYVPFGGNGGQVYLYRIESQFQVLLALPCSNTVWDKVITIFDCSKFKILKSHWCYTCHLIVPYCIGIVHGLITHVSTHFVVILHTCSLIPWSHYTRVLSFRGLTLTKQVFTQSVG